MIKCDSGAKVRVAFGLVPADENAAEPVPDQG
jgi:hypothetical protein